ncbi:hypothetical protein PIB30_029612 [Stylosanthes scabra]|uniref:RRM domain-containing protein n=1 Tax=Stylosanthes scabra TaxID=79078 RepID=A0ABU6QAS1_9FABA|nr:hypothetical protein [Stylosanthes scabra]
MDGKWFMMERENYSIFVDNLPTHISKRFLYREFSFHGNVVDVFISRKSRKGKVNMFAFIRYDSKGGAMRAIEKLDRSYIPGKVMTVKEAKYRRNVKVDRGDKDSVKRWMRKPSNEYPTMGNQKEDSEQRASLMKQQTKERRVMEVMVSEEQKEMLDKSILAESFEPIKFGLVVDQLNKIEEQYGKVEYRDLGPKKCILSLDSIKLRNRALADAIFTEMFDEVREYWGFKWAFSRRVWIELMGLPIHVWSKDTLERMAKGLDAKLEVGEEVLSRQVHPDGFSADGTVVGNSLSPSTAFIHGEPDRNHEEEVMSRGEEGDNRAVGAEITIEECMKRGLGCMKVSMRMQSIVDNELMSGKSSENVREGVGPGADDPEIRDDLVLFGGPNTCVDQKYDKDGRSLCEPSGLLEEERYGSNDFSCPFPPGFGPCGNGPHIHRDLEAGQRHNEAGMEAGNRHEEDENPNMNRISNKDDIDVTHIPETNEERAEALETRRVCEEGGLLLQHEMEDVFLRDLVRDKERVENTKGGK